MIIKKRIFNWLTDTKEYIDFRNYITSKKQLNWIPEILYRRETERETLSDKTYREESTHTFQFWKRKSLKGKILFITLYWNSWDLVWIAHSFRGTSKWFSNQSRDYRKHIDRSSNFIFAVGSFDISEIGRSSLSFFEYNPSASEYTTPLKHTVLSSTSLKENVRITA